jgi:hypothetical protein
MIGSGWLPTIIYPSTVKDAQTQMAASVSGVDQSVQTCRELDPATTASWVLFRDAILAFCNEDPGIWGLGSRMDRVESYQTELYAWQQFLAGKCTTSVPPVPQPEAPPQSGGPWLPIAQLGLYTTLAVAGVYGVSILIEPVKETASAVKRLKKARPA